MLAIWHSFRIDWYFVWRKKFNLLNLILNWYHHVMVSQSRGTRQPSPRQQLSTAINRVKNGPNTTNFFGKCNKNIQKNIGIRAKKRCQKRISMLVDNVTFGNARWPTKKCFNYVLVAGIWIYLYVYVICKLFKQKGFNSKNTVSVFSIFLRRSVLSITFKRKLYQTGLVTLRSIRWTL